MHGGGAAGTAAAQHAGRLGWALPLTATHMVAEVGAGLLIKTPLLVVFLTLRFLPSPRLGCRPTAP